MKQFLKMFNYHSTKLFTKKIIWAGGMILVIAIIITAVYFWPKKEYKPPMVLTTEQIQGYQARMAELKNLLIEFPDYYEVYIELGSISRNLGDYKNAIKYTKRAGEIVTASSIPWLNLASYYSEMNEYDKAYESLWQAQKVSPEYYLTYIKIVDFYKWFYPQKIDEIPLVYELGIKESNDPNLVKTYADYLYDNNRKTDALKYYEQLKQYNPNNEQVNNRINEIIGAGE